MGNTKPAHPEELQRKYAEQIKESQEIVNAANSFKEHKRVPVIIGTGGSYYAHMFGFDIGKFYIDTDIQVEVRLRANEWNFQYLKSDNSSTSVGLDIGPVAEALVFDCPIARPPGTSPRIIPILENEDDIKKLRLPKPEKCEGLKWLDRQFEKFTASAGRFGITLKSKGPHLSIHPPLSSACAIMEPEKVYYLMAAKPDVIKDFFTKMHEAFCIVLDYYDKRYNPGFKRESIGLANDNSCFISNEMYVDQVLEFDKDIYERYGNKYRWLHTDGPSDHHFKTFAEELKLTIMDIGGWSSIDTAVKTMKGRVVIHGGLNCKDIYGKLTAGVKAKINHAIKAAAPGGGYRFAIGGETYVGVPPETLVELVKYVKQAGKYPLSI